MVQWISIEEEVKLRRMKANHIFMMEVRKNSKIKK